jgi:acetyl esterase
MSDEGVLDPWVADWMAANPMRATPFDDLSPEMLELARSPMGFPPTRDVAEIADDEVEGIPIRIYRDPGAVGLVVYFHGGGFVIGSIGLMDNVARELTHASGAVVVSVGYRLAPEHPFPAGLDDCETVVRWAFANAERLGVSTSSIAVAGESAGGNLSAAVALRLRLAGDLTLAGQALLYPGVSGPRERAQFASAKEYVGLVLNEKGMAAFSAAYAGGRDIEDDPFAHPLCAPDLSGLPPALVVVGGCDVLRDEGRAYAQRLRESGVDVEEHCYAGQPHGFLNFDFPAAADAYRGIGPWLRARLAPT